MCQCFHCLNNTVCWDCNYDFEDFGYEGEGIVQICHYSSCGAEIEYRIPTALNIKGIEEGSYENNYSNDVSSEEE